MRETSTLERVRIVVNMIIVHLGFKSQKELGFALGYQTSSSFSQILKGSVPLSQKFFNRLFTKFPFINQDYILKGEGEYFIQGVDTRIDDISTSQKIVNIAEMGKPTASKASQIAELIENNNKLTQCLMILIEQNKTISEQLKEVLSRLQ